MRKEYFVANEIMFDHATIDFVAKQVFSMVRAPACRHGVDAAITALGAQTLLQTDGKFDADAKDWLLQAHPVELQALAKSSKAELGGDTIDHAVAAILAKAQKMSR